DVFISPLSRDDEATVIEDISTYVLNKLVNSPQPSHFDNLVGMSTHMENLELLLSLGSKEVRMVGIWGPSGIGKSTIARVLFNQHSHQFQFSVFMENIKRLWPRPYYDEYSVKLQLQEEFLSRLPLGLRVMGSHFKGRPKHEWEEGLPRLRTRLNGEIENTLKFSYDALCDDDQAIFLHLACFLKHDWLETVERCLEKNFVGVKGCLRVLAEKSFISAEWGYIQMHDLLALLGREIVRKQSIHEPGQRQFLVDAGDICQVLRDDTLGSRNVIGIDLDLSKLLETGLKISDRVFKRMPNVQFLRVKYHSKPYPHSIDPVTCLPSNLRILDWDSFPMTCLPSNFNPEFLVEIVLTKSNFLEKLWEGNKTIRNLKLMNLSNSKNLKELPDLSTATNLQTLDLSGCSSLTELPFSIGNAINLRYLDLTNCSSLVEFPSSMENVTTLEELFLKDCSSLVELPSSVRNSLNLKVFTCSGCSNLVELPLHIDNANDRKRLDLSGCSSLRELPSSIGNMTNLMELDLRGCSSLRELPSSIGNITNLEKLYLNGCSSLVELSSSIGNMTNLMKLYLYGCSSLRELPSSIGNITSLEELDLYGCSSLVELPSSIGNMTNLEELNLIGCSSLVELPSSIGNMSSLMKLYPRECSSLVEFPSTIGNMTSRKELNLNGCSSLVELPASIGNMTSLEELNLNGCSSLVKLPSSVGDMSNLRKLYLESCSNLTVLPININMKSLDELVLTDCSSLKSFPEISTNIRVLKLSGTAIEELPPSIMSWPHLRELVIKGCLKLVSLPQLPDSLEFLVADNCGSLERLDCSFNKKKFHALRFVNCFKLNQEARDLIINTSTRDLTILPGETVPTYFSYRATGSSLSMTWNGLDTEHFPTSLRFKACILVVYKGEVDAYDWGCPEICCCITDELNGVKHYSHRWVKWPPTSGEHLFVFEIEDAVSAPELVFEFEYGQENWEIKECWIHPLETLAPSPFNMKSLDEVDLTDCSSLKSFPMISTNNRFLKLNGTAVEEIPPSTKIWPRLQKLRMPYSENLACFCPHRGAALERHKNIRNCSMDQGNGCTKLVSLPQLPASLAILDAYNCESLERLDCSFNRKKFHTLSFVNFFKLNQEARDLIINTWIGNMAVFPGESVPAYFTYKATGNSLSMKWNGLDTHFRKRLRFKACACWFNRPDVEACDWREIKISCCIKDKLNVVKSRHSTLWFKFFPTSKEHLVVFEFEEDAPNALLSQSTESTFHVALFNYTKSIFVSLFAPQSVASSLILFPTSQMDFSLFLTIVAAAIGFFVIRRFRFNPENNEIDTSSLSPSSPPSSLSSRDDEATVIENISTCVLNKLVNSPQPSHFDNLVGMSTHMENLELLLSLGSKEVRMVGIWGPSGIGKSTIARVLFNQHSHQFQFSVFMENIKRLWPRPYYDEYSVKLQLQEEFLSRKSFISFEWGRIKMHDLLALLGREIVRKQSIHEPGQRQFLVDAGDICQVLRNDTLGSRNVIGIDLDLTKLETEVKISDRVFERMPNVQFLRVKYRSIQRKPYPHSIDPVTCLPPNLIILHWDYFPMTCLPSNFNPEFLTRIILTENNYLEKLWEGNKTIRNLKLMNLSNSKNLKELPDLSTATNLQTLELSGCSSLTELPFSIGNAINLRRLNLSHCSSLMELPSSMENATDLEELNLTGCLHLAKLPSSIGNLKKLYLKDCSSLVELPSSVRNSINLKNFSFNGCSNLVELPFYLGNATDLQRLYLRGCSKCSSLVELPSSIGNITSLEYLNLDACSSLVKLPSSIGDIINLKNLYLNGCSKLNLNGCSSLVELPSSIGNMNNLWMLYLERCSNLTALPININMKSLRVLALTDCSSLKSFPEISTNIRVLKLTGTAIEEIPPSIMSWPWLSELNIDTGIQETAPWVKKERSRIRELVIKRCTEQHKSNVFIVINCLKLNQETRDLIIKTSTRDFTILPGETVPTYFSYRAAGSSLSMTWNGLDTEYFPTSLRFRACLLLVYKGHVGGHRQWSEITYCIKDKLTGVERYSHRFVNLPPTPDDHLFVFEIEETVSAPELVFEFGFTNKNWEIKKCGLHPLETPSC
ncbi:hypothetical protein HID58_012453, partial [Brassica napus]